MLCVGKARLFDLEAIELIEGPPDRILTRADFRPYQVWMSRTMLGTWKQPDVQGVLMGADMGLGKTATTLYALYKLLRKGHIKKVLIVAPKYVAENSWPGEIACWDFARTLTYSVVTGTEEERLAALRYPAEINIINRENLVWLKRTWGRKWPYDFLVYDEASRLKGGSKRVKKSKRKDGTVRHKGMSEFGVLARMRYTFAKVIELSGTPSPNGLIDLWGPIFIIDKGKRLGESRTAYERRWFQENEKAHKFTPFDHSEKEIMGNVKDVFFTLSSEDYLDLPPLIVNDKFVTLSPAHMKLYKKFEKERALDEWDVEAVNKGVLVNKLLQAANGSIYRADDLPVKHIHDEKIDALASIIEESGGTPVLVAYSFKFDLERIKKRFKHARIFGEGKNDYRDWNAGKIPLMLVHPASAGHGLNFQHGGNIAVFYGLTWSLELYRQFVKRLHRSGQKADRVFLHRILAKGTADEDVVRVLSMKGATQDAISDAVRVRLKKAIGEMDVE